MLTADFCVGDRARISHNLTSVSVRRRPSQWQRAAIGRRGHVRIMEATHRTSRACPANRLRSSSPFTVMMKKQISCLGAGCRARHPPAQMLSKKGSLNSRTFVVPSPWSAGGEPMCEFGGPARLEQLLACFALSHRECERPLRSYCRKGRIAQSSSSHVYVRQGVRQPFLGRDSVQRSQWPRKRMRISSSWRYNNR